MSPDRLIKLKITKGIIRELKSAFTFLLILNLLLYVKVEHTLPEAKDITSIVIYHIP